MTRPSTSPSPGTTGAAPVTLAEAKGVLAGYTTANNNANAQRSDTQLAAAETGSSFAIDAGLYVTQAAAGTAPYPAFGPVQATYYIPGNEPAGGPRWFVVQVANAFNSAPGKVTSNEYLLFTQSAAGGTWQDTIEPYLLSGAGNPQIETGTDGLATAVSPDTATLKVDTQPAPRRRPPPRSTAPPPPPASPAPATSPTRPPRPSTRARTPAEPSPTPTRPRPAPTDSSTPSRPPTAAPSSSTPTPPTSPSPRRPAPPSTSPSPASTPPSSPSPRPRSATSNSSPPTTPPPGAAAPPHHRRLLRNHRQD